MPANLGIDHYEKLGDIGNGKPFFIKTSRVLREGVQDQEEVRWPCHGVEGAELWQDGGEGKAAAGHRGQHTQRA